MPETYAIGTHDSARFGPMDAPGTQDIVPGLTGRQRAGTGRGCDEIGRVKVGGKTHR